MRTSAVFPLVKVTFHAIPAQFRGDFLGNHVTAQELCQTAKGPGISAGALAYIAVVCVGRNEDWASNRRDVREYAR